MNKVLIREVIGQRASTQKVACKTMVRLFDSLLQLCSHAFFLEAYTDDRHDLPSVCSTWNFIVFHYQRGLLLCSCTVCSFGLLFSLRSGKDQRRA